MTAYQIIDLWERMSCCERVEFYIAFQLVRHKKQIIKTMEYIALITAISILCK